MNNIYVTLYIQKRKHNILIKRLGLSRFSLSLKVAFFQRVRFVFQISQFPKNIIPKNYPELEIWIYCLLIWAGISNFKIRIVFLEYLFLGDWEIWKTNLTFWKKDTCSNLISINFTCSVCNGPKHPRVHPWQTFWVRIQYGWVSWGCRKWTWIYDP